MTFPEIFAITESIPGSFTLLSAGQLYRYALDVPQKGIVVEVGVDQGRSASILLAASFITGATTHLIDSWESCLSDNVVKLRDMIRLNFPETRYAINHCKSVYASTLFDDGSIDLLHIDANHYAPNPEWDCYAWLPKVRKGGVACFHDYDPSWPDVVAAVDKHCAGWVDLGVWDSLAVRRKA